MTDAEFHQQQLEQQEREMEIYKKLEQIQKTLKAPKNQMNKFGGYKYRSCEDILEAVKPLLDGCVVTISDTIREVGGRVYVEAEATISDGFNQVTCTAFAREPADRKGMDESQITGSASSYARKYALNGLFLIDDTKDADATNDHQPKKETLKPLDVGVVIDAMNKAKDKQTLLKYYEAAIGRANKEQLEMIQFTFDNLEATLEQK
jgi:CRISPR/Cas system CSM-associated protein Csm2 small subunit